MDRLTEPELIASLADLESSPEAHEPPQYDPDWSPKLNPTQRLFYEDPSKFILAYGERGSGKSVGAVHKMLHHCWNNFNALAIMIVGIKRQAMEGGAWHKMEFDILPEWGAGVGMQYTESRTNTAKDTFIFVSNRFGSWSKVLLLSMPVGAFIRDRAKGLEPSFILIDEAQTLEGDDYFSVLVQQLDRRPNISGRQQYVATCNPEGPSHWLYKRFFITPIDPDTGQWNVMYHKFHIPIVENLANLPSGYYDNVVEATKDDPIEYRRMVLGEWIDRPSGEAIFKEYYSELLNVRGNNKENLRIIPKRDHDICIGYDLGTVNSALVFLQNIPAKDRDLWVVFDEMVYTDSYIPYTKLVPEIMRRIAFWNDRVGCDFNVQHISDSSAFNQYRAHVGTYDALEVERLSRESVATAFPKLKPIKLIECPKFAGSVPGRVKVTMKLLQQERLIISDSCVKVKAMFMHLESEKMDERKKYSPDLPFSPKRSKHLHPFDALSYVLFYFALGNQVHKQESGSFFFMGKH